MHIWIYLTFWDRFLLPSMRSVFFDNSILKVTLLVNDLNEYRPTTAKYQFLYDTRIDTFFVF